MANREDNENREAKEDRKTRKKKRKSPIWKRLGIFFGILLVLLIVGIAVFRVDNLQIEGNSRVSDDEIKTLIRWEDSQENTLLLWLLNRKVDVSSNHLVADIKVSISNPRTVRVQVEEESLVACVQIGQQYFYLNTDGLVVLSQEEQLTDVALLEGLEITRAEEGSALETDDSGQLADMLAAAECLMGYGISVDTISETDEGGLTAQMGSIRIFLGKNIYMDEKISELNDLLPELEGLSGTLHLEDYDSTKDSIIFTKDS